MRREGARGLFAGYGSFLLRDLPFDAIEFMAYEQLKKAYKVSSDSRGMHVLIVASSTRPARFLRSRIPAVLHARLMGRV